MEVPEEVRALAAERDEARAAKDFARADALRDRIAAAGWTVTDSPSGPAFEPAAREPSYTVWTPAATPDRLGEPATFDLSLHLLYEGFPEDLERFLGAVARTTDLARVETVIVDNASPDGERLEEIAAGTPNARVVHVAPDHGWAAARNAGLRTSTGRLCVLADLSIEPGADLLAPLGDAFADPSVAVAGPFGLVSDDMRSWTDSPGPEVDAIEGYLMAFRRDALRDGLIHERFRWYRNADIDLSFQLRAGGGKAVVVDLPVERHTHRGWSAVGDDERQKLSKRNHYTFFGRWKAREDLLIARRA